MRERESDDVSPLPVALPLAGRPVLVLGGGSEAEEKVTKLRAAGALVTLVSREVTPALAQRARRRELDWFARAFQPSDVQGMHLVMLTELDDALARELIALRGGARFWVCAIDQPAYSDIYLVSTVVRGPVQIGISTGGRAPLLARVLRRALDAGLDSRFSEFAHGFARLRSALREAPKSERLKRLEEALEGFAMEVRLSYPAEESDGGRRGD